MKSVFPVKSQIPANQRAQLMQQAPCLIWFTGLSGSGKSTLASMLEKHLFEQGYKIYLLDGDTIRTGLNKDLSFSEKDRKENLRRIGEVAKLMVDAGLIVIAAFISPYQEDRDRIRKKLGKDRFVEIFVDCPIEICEQRDVKGLYKRARNSEIKDFTGIDSPYEIPTNPDLVLKTGKEEISVSLNKIADYLKKNFGLQEH